MPLGFTGPREVGGAKAALALVLYSQWKTVTLQVPGNPSEFKN